MGDREGTVSTHHRPGRAVLALSRSRQRWAALLVLGAVACKTPVRSGLSESDANEVVVALDRAAIEADKQLENGAEQRYAVTVASADGVRALRLLEAEQLPRAKQPGFETLYGEPAWLATPGEDRARWVAALSGELSRSLQRMPGVLDARVHLAPAEAPVALDATPAMMRAAVLLRRRADAPALDEAPIRRLLTGAVQDLEPDRVTIVQVGSEAQSERVTSFERVGPFNASKQSAPALRLVLSVSLGLHLMLAMALMLATWRRHRSASDNS